MASLEPVAFAYDPRGRLSAVRPGTGGSARTSTFSYNPEGFLQSITDPLSRTVTFTYDPACRVLTQTLPDLRVIETHYDANGNVASIAPPSRPVHSFGYTPIDLEAAYTPPDLGTGPVATTYTYNPDRQLTAVLRPAVGGDVVSFIAFCSVRPRLLRLDTLLPVLLRPGPATSPPESRRGASASDMPTD